MPADPPLSERFCALTPAGSAALPRISTYALETGGNSPFPPRRSLCEVARLLNGEVSRSISDCWEPETGFCVLVWTVVYWCELLTAISSATTYREWFEP